MEDEGKTKEQLIEELAELRRRIAGTEAGHQQEEERYRRFFSDARVALFRTRISDGTVLECNQFFATVFGYGSREE